MAYLLTQILFCVLFAAVAGGAIAWLLQNRRFSKREDEFRHSLDRHAQALSRSRSETKMVLGDFDDLKASSDAHIAELQHETARIPQLNENLEKSQTLVRQMLQKHDAELHALNSDNERLQGKLATLELRERDAESEITALRKKIAVIDSDTSVETDPEEDFGPVSAELQPAAVEQTTSANAEISVATPVTSLADDGLERQIDNDLVATETIDGALLGEALPESVATGARPIVTTSNRAASTAAITEPADIAPVASIESSPDLLDEDDVMNRTWLGDGTEVLAHDDLQSIHGIGPLMEQSLNDIGITSYHQIAKLTCGEIEQIAEILEIFPGRIERDDWVGNARRLASEELEEA